MPELTFATYPQPQRELPCPQGSKYPNRRYLPQTILTVPDMEALNTLYYFPLDPKGAVRHPTSYLCLKLPGPPKVRRTMVLSAVARIVAPSFYILLGSRCGITVQLTQKSLEYGPRTIYAGFPSFLGCAIWGQSYSNILTSSVHGPQLYEQSWSVGLSLGALGHHFFLGVGCGQAQLAFHLDHGLLQIFQKF